jgi:hypothetical protein
MWNVSCGDFEVPIGFECFIFGGDKIALDILQVFERLQDIQVADGV